MSENSPLRSLQTTPIVSDLPVRADRSGAAGRASGAVVAGVGTRGPVTATAGLPFQVGELVLADLEIVAARQLVRLDPAPVDVGAVERSQAIEEEPAPPPP